LAHVTHTAIHMWKDCCTKETCFKFFGGLFAFQFLILLLHCCNSVCLLAACILHQSFSACSRSSSLVCRGLLKGLYWGGGPLSFQLRRVAKSFTTHTKVCVCVCVCASLHSSCRTRCCWQAFIFFNLLDLFCCICQSNSQLEVFPQCPREGAAWATAPPRGN
jgi:hypothetical protein